MDNRKRDRLRNLFAFLTDILIILFEMIGFGISVRSIGLRTFIYYTQDSNLILLIACLATVVSRIPVMTGKRSRIPKWASLLKYCAVCLTTVTFLVVILILAPMYGGDGNAYAQMLFQGSMLFHHTLCPVIGLISFVCFEKDIRITWKQTAWALVPTLVYEYITVTLNFLRLLRGPYPFLFVYEQPWFMSLIWGISIPLGAYMIALGVKVLSDFGQTS